MNTAFTCIVFLSIVIGGTLFGLPMLTTAINGGIPFPAETIVNLTVAVLTLEATVFIAAFIYALQQKDTEKAATKQEIGAKKILYAELSAGLEAVIRTPCSGGVGDVSDQLSQLLITYLPYIQDSFEPEELHHLLQLVEVMSCAAKRAASEDSAAAAEYIKGWLGLFVEERFVPAMKSQYSNQFFRLDDYCRILTPLTRSVLEILSGEFLMPAAENRLTALDGTLLLEVAPNGYTKIYDTEGEPLCNALLDTDAVGGYGIEAGWAKTRRYVGEFKDGLRHGQGCSYSLWKHHKVFEGKWENDEPRTGTQFHVVFEKDPCDGKYKDLFPYWDEHHIISDHVTAYLTQRDDLVPKEVLARLYIAESVWVEDEHIFCDIDTFYLLADFMKESDPDNLSRIQKLNNLFIYDDEEEDECLD